MRTMLNMVGRLFCGFALVAVLLVGAARVPAAHATAPLGACCVHGGGCQDVIELQCASINGDFIGAGTSCATADCLAQVGAPLLSIFGLIVAAGGLGGLGVYR